MDLFKNKNKNLGWAGLGWAGPGLEKPSIFVLFLN
jgi:hypothetical protein